MPIIQVFIATYNRAALVLSSINSVLNQDFDSFEIIVSDNSTNNETEKLISQLNCNRLKYKRRNPSLPVIDHLNVILQEVTSDYFMIFHDDDIMFSNMLSELYAIITENNKTIAVGGNALINREGVSLNELVYNYSQDNLILKTKDEVAFQYLSKSGGIVPFPSYLYKKEVASNCRFDSAKGGKHCDVAFIMDLTDYGHIIFITKPLMEYFYHKGQDSAQHSSTDILKMIFYVEQTTNYNAKSKLVVNFQMTNLYIELRAGLSNGTIPINSNRFREMMIQLFKSLRFIYFSKALIIGLYLFLKKSFRKGSLFL